MSKILCGPLYVAGIKHKQTRCWRVIFRTMIAVHEHYLFLRISISFEFLWSFSSKEAQSIYSNSFLLALSIPYLNVFQVNGTMQKHIVSELSKSFQIAKPQRSKTSFKKILN